MSDFDPSANLEQRVTELENLLQMEHRLIDALTERFNQLLDSNELLIESTESLCATTKELIETTKRRQEP